MKFCIELDDDESDPALEGAFQGCIKIGSFEESFVSSRLFWSADQYREHWHDAVKRVVREGKDSCLITSIADPGNSTRLYWWPMYRDGDTVHFQNSICFFDQLPVPFDVDNPYASVSPRERTSEDGEELSEWDIHVDDLEDFLRARLGLPW